MTTRIADLPFSVPSAPQGGGGGGPFSENNYTPINVHPNPYGYEDATVATTAPPPPQNTSSGRGASVADLSPSQIQMLQNTPPQKVPSRDIHVSNTDYTQDETVIANYIPPPRPDRGIDYIKEYEMDNVRKQSEHAKKRNQSERFDWIMDQIQFPTLVAILFFIFQYPLVDKLALKWLDGVFIPLFNADGNYNLYGKVTKSVIFGVIIYMLSKTTEYISSI